jgi:hypothetical protein
MEFPAKRSEMASEIVALQKQQVQATSNATFVGWTSDTSAAFESRTDRIAVLLIELARIAED